MADDNAVLPLSNDLTKHLISEGLIDFETYNFHTPHRNHQSYQSDSSVLADTSDSKINDACYISRDDLDKLISLRNSKLLLPEDFELLDFLISRTSTPKWQANYLWLGLFGGSITASTISVGLYLSKRTSFYLPTTLVSTLFFISLRHCYFNFKRISEKKSFFSAMSFLQNLCLNINKLFRLLKETEILSTGQVSTNNIGAALYIPVKNLDGPERLASWKTLPHLRKCLGNTLLDIIDLLKLSCDEARRMIPHWLNIKGFTLSNENTLLDSLLVEKVRMTDEFISLKDLQILNDSYLLLQSELLRWISFCICPSAWCNSDLKFKSSRIQGLNLFFSLHSKLTVLSFKLKMLYDIQDIFNESGTLFSQQIKNSNKLEIIHVQSELHKFYLLILSMLVHLKNLEDQFENNSYNITATELNSLKKSMNEQLGNVKNDITSASNMFDTICLQSISSKKLKHNVQSDIIRDKESFVIRKNSKSHVDLPGETCEFDCHGDVLDEVFLGTTDFVNRDLEKQRDDWDIERNPSIPSTLMTELSTTLKPIKEIFKEREKAALERAGLEDINDESTSENEVPWGEVKTNSFAAKPLSKMKKKRGVCRLRRHNQVPASHGNDEESDTSSTEESVNDVGGLHSVQDLSNIDSNSITSFSVLNDKSIASMVAVKSQTWGLAEEDYFSDN